MLTVAEARELVAKHIGDTSRARHSLFVGYAMRRLAERLAEDATVLWEVVGLVHDVDYEATATDQSRHGLVTSEWLAGRLTDDALTAIAAHDHRTGIRADTRLATALKLADALAVICETIGLDEAAIELEAVEPAVILAGRFADRPYLPELLTEAAARLAVPYSLLARIARTGPPPA